MPKSILMPQVGQDLAEGVIVTWNVRVGDRVNKGDIVAMVESEKASFEVEAFESGTVAKLLYEEGDVATVLEPILYLYGEEDEAVAPDSMGHEKLRAEADGITRDHQTSTHKLAPGKKERRVGRSSSPLARRLAKKHGLDIKQIAGTGPSGAVVKRDVENALEFSFSSTLHKPSTASSKALPTIANDDRVEPFNNLRQVIANRLLLAKQTIPHFYLRTEVDVTNLLIRREAHLDMGLVKVSVNDVIIHATALALLEYPRLNAHVSSDHVIIRGIINVGVAVSVGDGLVVPVVENTAFLSAVEIAETMRSLADAARRGIQKSTARGTFTISNLGMFGVEVLPIINPPEAAILGVGPIRKAFHPHQGGIQLRDVITLTLAGDHRAIDGAYGAQFLQCLGKILTDYNLFSSSNQLKN